MKKATAKQIANVAKIHDAIGFNGTCLYGITNGEVTRYAAIVCHDSFHYLAKDGILKYNGDFTYSIAK